MINDIWTWLSEHKEEILQIWTGLVTLTSIVVKLIPTLPKKTKGLGLLKFIAKWVALNNNVVDSERPKK